MKRNGEQLYYPQSGTEGCRAATRYYEGSPNPRLEKLRQGKCRVDSE